jgi:hypothetical protein
LAVNIGDYLLVKDFQTMFQQQILNVYTFRVTATPADPTYAGFLDAFENTFVTDIAAQQCDVLTHNRIEVDNLTNGLEFAAKDISVQGGGSCGSPAPPFVCVSIRMSRSTKITRNGYKRYAGLSSTSYEDGVLVTAAVQSWSLQVAALLDNPVSWIDNNSETWTWESVIIGRNKVTGDYDLSRVNEVASAVVLENVTTQNTRKYGRGV